MTAGATDKHCILLVDDSPQQLYLLTETLKHDYIVRAATTGEKALTLAQIEPRPAVIVLDLIMPGLDGFETCRRLKDNPATQEAVIIFLSASDNTEDKLTGYEVGARDFLIKPVEPDILLKKIQLAIQAKNSAEKMQAEKQFATHTARIALSSAGELSVVLEFMRRSFSFLHPEGLGKAVTDAIQQYSLDSTLQIRSSQGTFHVSSTGIASPLEADLLSRMNDRGRLIERGNNLIINFSRCSLLVKNMPVEEDVHGRARDNLCLLMEGAEARLSAMDLEAVHDQLKHSLVDSVNALRQQLGSLHRHKAERTQLRETSHALIVKQKQRLAKTLEALDLGPEPINETTQALESALSCLQENFEHGLATDDQILSLFEQMNTILQKVTQT